MKQNFSGNFTSALLKSFLLSAYECEYNYLKKKKNSQATLFHFVCAKFVFSKSRFGFLVSFYHVVFSLILTPILNLCETVYYSYTWVLVSRKFCAFGCYSYTWILFSLLNQLWISPSAYIPFAFNFFYGFLLYYTVYIKVTYPE